MGTIVTAMAGYALVSGASLGRDLIGPRMSPEAQTLWTRVGILVSLALAIALAVWIDSVVALWYSWGGCIIGALILPVSASYSIIKLPSLKSWAHPTAMAAAFAASLIWLITGTASGNPLLNVTLPGGFFGYTDSSQSGFTFSVGTLLPSLVVSGLAIAICTWVARDERERGTDTRSR